MTLGVRPVPFILALLSDQSDNALRFSDTLTVQILPSFSAGPAIGRVNGRVQVLIQLAGTDGVTSTCLIRLESPWIPYGRDRGADDRILGNINSRYVDNLAANGGKNQREVNVEDSVTAFVMIGL